jgi:hypothetical protein
MPIVPSRHKLRTRDYLVRGVMVLLLLPLPIDLWFVYKDLRYSVIIWLYECKHDVCEADFDGDGSSGKTFIDHTTPPPQPKIPAFQGWLVVTDRGRELARLPYRYIDNTIRTHVAVHSEYGRPRLLIYDQIKMGVAPPNGVYGWDGVQISRTQPTEFEKDILAAMAARDDMGSWNKWAFYRLLRIPIFLIYYLPLIVTLIRLKRKRALLKLDEKYS